MRTYRNITFNFHILYGLPGSGKTYYANKNFNDEHLFRHTDKMTMPLDNYQTHDNFYDNAMDMIKDGKFAMQEIYCNGTFENINICIDGLITTIENVKTLALVINDYLKETFANINKYYKDNEKLSYNVNFIIHKWDENREVCLHNDNIRVKNNERECSTAISIKSLPYDNITKNDIKCLKQICEYTKHISIETHLVKKIDLYDTKFEPLIGYNRPSSYGGHCPSNNSERVKTKYMYSEDWSGGGTWGNCWGGSGTIDSSSPVNFNKFENLLEKICSEISHKNYKKIWEACVDIEETREYDYYGGSEIRLRWRCDVPKLYNMLVKMNLINPNELDNV